MSVQQIPFDRSTIRAIVGLGNPGPRFTFTRHNIGFLFVEYLAQKYGAGPWRPAPNCLQTSIAIEGLGTILLIKPETFMNTSGQIQPFLAKQGIKAPESVLVVHDELEKKFGALQLRCGGSARGHNGLRSLIAHIGQNFWRLRIGVDRPEDRSQVANYVLEPFPRSEQAQFDVLFDEAARCIDL
jgi:PTH1 family peptidyl-tRNA hydrolase